MCLFQLMTGYDSSDDKSPESIAMLALAVFSTSYNLPVYLRYNMTYRRTFLRMLRCEAGYDPDNEQTGATARGGSETAYRQQATLRRGPDTTSREHHGRRVDTERHCVVWTRRANTEGPATSDSNVVVERY